MEVYDEIWQPVIDYPNYKVSNHGNVINIKNNRPKTVSKGRSGYLYLGLSNKKGPQRFYVHRLVAQHFLPNPKDKKEVNHLGTKDDNRACMLEWATRGENMAHAHKEIIKYRKVAIKGTSKTTGEIKLYDTPKDAVKDAFSPAAILNCLRGKSSSSGGYTWEYVNKKVKIENLDGEVWVSLKDSVYEDVKKFTRYLVSNMARVKNQHDTLVNNRLCGNTLTVKLMNGNTAKRISLHRLVIMAFNVPNPDNKPQVDHIDSDWSNNKLDNLRWVTSKENMANPATIEKRLGRLNI